MAGTVVVDARVRLVDILSSGVLPGVTVHYSHPGEKLLGTEAVWFEPAKAECEPVGHRAVKIRRNETIVQPFRIAVLGDGMTQQQADARCIEIMEQIEDTLALAANVALTNAVGTNQQIHHCIIRRWEQLADALESGNRSGLYVELETDARSL